MVYSIFHTFRFSRLIAITLVLSLVGLTLSAQERLTGVSSSSSQYEPNKFSRGESEESNKRRIREGTTIVDRGGFFRLDGEGATFVVEDDYEFGALPNLNLERVLRTLKGYDEAESIRWSVSGVVTEFNGRNYLLIKRAVYKSSVPPPLPEQVAN